MPALPHRIDDHPGKDEAVLKILCDRLEVDHIVPFQEACRELVATGRQRLVVDLCGFRSLPSVILGAVADAHSSAPGRHVVVAADSATTGLFRRIFKQMLDFVEPQSRT